MMSDCVSEGDTAERKVSYVTPFKKQMIGPREAKAIEVYESKGMPDQSFAVDVKVHTPEVCPPRFATVQRFAALWLAVTA